MQSVFAAMLIGACAVTSAQAKDLTPPISLSGNGLKNTQPFKVGDRWEFQWNSTGILFQVFLYSADGEPVNLLANQQGAGPGSSFQPKGGEYYLQINAVGPWDIKIVNAD